MTTNAMEFFESNPSGNGNRAQGQLDKLLKAVGQKTLATQEKTAGIRPQGTSKSEKMMFLKMILADSLLGIAATALPHVAKLAGPVLDKVYGWAKDRLSGLLNPADKEQAVE